MAKSDESTLVFDFSRTVSRVGRGRPTGIDRVERAYIEYLLKQSRPVLFVARFWKAFHWLDRSAMRAFLERVDANGPWDTPALLTKILHAKNPIVTKSNTTVRRLGLSRANIRNAPINGCTYINVGHANLAPSLWPKLRSLGVSKIMLMVHDMIPLDYPEYTSASISAKFETNMKAALKTADILVFNSEETAKRTNVWLRKWGSGVGTQHTVHLGTNPLPQSGEYKLSDDTPNHFVCLGTIEPRKNHQLLLKVWQGFHRDLAPDDIPLLHIVGARGWLNKQVFEMLDTAEFMGKTVFEHSNLPDEDLVILMQNAKALLFPSYAEGFGFPLVEALQLGVPVLASDLPSFREISGTIPIYISDGDPEKWAENILKLASANRNHYRAKLGDINLPTWDAHFHKIATILSDTNTKI